MDWTELLDEDPERAAKIIMAHDMKYIIEEQGYVEEDFDKLCNYAWDLYLESENISILTIVTAIVCELLDNRKLEEITIDDCYLYSY